MRKAFELAYDDKVLGLSEILHTISKMTLETNYLNGPNLIQNGDSISVTTVKFVS